MTGTVIYVRLNNPGYHYHDRDRKRKHKDQAVSFLNFYPSCIICIPFTNIEFYPFLTDISISTYIPCFYPCIFKTLPSSLLQLFTSFSTLHAAFAGLVDGRHIALIPVSGSMYFL